MKKQITMLLSGCAMALILPMAADAQQMPGRHPAYMHALSDLRAARWLNANRPGDPFITQQEQIAIAEIDRCIGEITAAAIDDGKNVNYQPPPDLQGVNTGRLAKAIELLNKVHSDIAREEDDDQTRGLRNRAIRHLDLAIGADNAALSEAQSSHH